MNLRAIVLRVFHFFCTTLIGVLSLLAQANAAEHCSWQSAAQRYGVNERVLYAIARQESGLNPAAVNHNTDGSYDLGLMQINSRWLPQLAKYGITAQHLLDSCINLNVGAYILAEGVKRHGNTWQAIGAYHSSTPWRRDRYAMAIYRHLAAQKLIQKNSE